MKLYWKEIAIVLFMSVVLPNLMISAVSRCAGFDGHLPQETGAEESIDATSGTENNITRQRNIPVLLDDGSVQTMDIDTYLTGVLLKEMPVKFEMEALKAQAVVARTYALRRILRADKHKEGAVCTDPSCCQAYSTIDTFLAGGGTEQGVEKARDAVKATGDTVITYEGDLIEATYFSCSGGMTEDARAVWGIDIPYLQSVSSPGEEAATHFTDTVTFLAEEFASILGQNFTGYPESWLEAVTYTDGGGVDTITLCGKTYKGTTFRSLLGLRSTCFALTAVGNKITITTKGYGHRVGMSQYGADAMAVQGSSYQDILNYYYHRIDLVNYSW